MPEESDLRREWEDTVETVRTPTGRLAVDPARAARAVEAAWQMITGPVNAFGQLMEHGYELGQQDAKAVDLALEAGAGAMMPAGMTRAVASEAAAELGITGSRLLSRPDAVKLMRDLK